MDSNCIKKVIMVAMFVVTTLLYRFVLYRCARRFRSLVSAIILLLLLYGCANNTLDATQPPAPQRVVVFASITVRDGQYGAFILQSQDSGRRWHFAQNLNSYDYSPRKIIAFLLPAGQYYINDWQLQVEGPGRPGQLEIFRGRSAIPTQMALVPQTVYYIGDYTISGAFGKSFFGTDIVVGARLNVNDSEKRDTDIFHQRYPLTKNWRTVSLASYIIASMQNDTKITSAATPSSQ